MLGLTDGVKSGESSYETELGNVLGFTNMWASQMSDALSRGYGTLSDFQYQLNDAVAAAKNTYDEYYDKANFFLNDPKFGKNSTQYKYWAEQRDQAQKAYEDAKKAANGMTDAVDELTESEEEYTNGSKKATSATKEFRDSLESTLAGQLNIFSKFEHY